MTTRPNAPAALRNQQPILEVLTKELRGDESVLEIGSGTGQHAVFLAARMPELQWQTSDVADNHAGISAWIENCGLSNVASPLLLDVTGSPVIDDDYDAVYSANTAHIMKISAVESMFAIAGAVLNREGVFCLYGPFNRHGKFTSDSNARFDESLKSRSPSMGIRDLDDLDAFAASAGMGRSGLYAMPCNNMLAVWRKTDSGEVRGDQSR